mgnify:CR=1 FL=1
MTFEIEATRQELLDGLSPASARFAILKRGTLLTRAFMDLSFEGKVTLTLIYNLLVIGQGDTLVNGGIVHVENRYLEAFGLTQDQIHRGIRECISSGFIRHLESDFFVVSKVWDSSQKTSL